MKYYSENLNILFDSQEELEKAEKEATERKEKEAAEKAQVSKEKKACSDIVKAADAKVEDAREKFLAARKEAREILDEADKKAREVIRAASKELSAAQEERYDALKNFNDKYGPYTMSFTGEKAYTEWKKAVEMFNNFFNHML